MIHPELWERIKSIEIASLDTGYSFQERLANENDWTVEYAQAAIEEYKRFTYLAVLSEQELMPPYSVEQVWRLHLTCTRHYWGEFTRALGRQLHYKPTHRTQADADRMDEQYTHTKRLYLEEFGTFAFPELWLSNSARLDGREDYVRVDRSRFMILEKPTMALGRSLLRFFGVAAFPLSVMAYAMAQTSGPIAGRLTATGWTVVAGIAIVIAVFGCLIWRLEHQGKARRPIRSET